jgi:hypothetical protein
MLDETVGSNTHWSIVHSPRHLSLSWTTQSSTVQFSGVIYLPGRYSLGLLERGSIEGIDI